MSQDPPPPDSPAPQAVLRDRASRFLGSNWAFGLSRTAARRRRTAVILAGAFLWSALAYMYHPPTWDPATGTGFLLYLFRALMNPPVFAVIFLLSTFFGAALFLARRYVAGMRARSMQQITRAAAALFGVLWAFLGYRLTELNIDPNFSKEFLAYPFEALFAPHIFRHVLVAGLAFWLAYRIAAMYLDDIFEIGEIAVAERFVLQAAFSSQYNLISIKDGEISPKDRNSPMVRIGGPGFVRVHLENAAMVERPDGASRVIGPTVDTRAGIEELSGFERLRSVISLLDHSGDLFVEERTLDGVRVRAEDVNFVFSVFRGGLPSTLLRPYPYSEEAIKTLVYRQGNMPLQLIMSSMIRGELARFISQHTLNEFLASISLPELETSQQQEADLREQSAQQGGTEVALPSLVSLNSPAFIPRAQLITDLFASEFAVQAAQRGLELKWIGVGTWATPGEIVPERHLEAWLLSRENLVRGSNLELARLQRDHQIAELMRLVHEVPILTYRRQIGEPPEEILRNLLVTYHSKLMEAYEIYQRGGQPVNEVDELRRAVVFLSRFIGRWLRAPS